MSKNKKEIFEPAKYMQMAIEVMQKSVDEPRKDGKISPKVGALIIKSDGTVETAFRGELRHGDHAEFTLLERKNRDADLAGSILFATLEPCAPGARKEPKLSCAERIVNARIKEVWIGIEDPDPDVDRKGIKFLEENGIKVKMFYPEYQKKIRLINSEFLKQAIDRNKSGKARKDLKLSVLENPLTNFSIENLSNEAIEYYLEKSKIGYKADSKELLNHFESAGLITKVKDSYVPTGFGLLLFGKNPREKFQNAAVKAKVKYGKNPSIPKDFEGPLVLIPRDIELWLQQVLHSEVSRKKFERKTETLFPIMPLREAVINALAHRDYEIEGAKTYIEIDDDKITVKSAGLPVSPITLDDVKNFKAPSLSRNPKITYIFNKMGYMEENELGMETFRGMHESYGLPMPFYSHTAPYLCLTFSRSIESVSKIEGKSVLKELTKEELTGYEWLKSKESSSKKEYSEHFGFDPKKAYRHLSKFKKLGLVTDNGESIRSNFYRYVYNGE